MQATSIALPPTGFLRITQILGDSKDGTPALLPVSKATLWQWVRDGKFPRPIKLGANTTAWKVEDVREFIEVVGRSAS